MQYGFKEFATDVMNYQNKPLSIIEIWNVGIELGLDKKLGSQGKTPWKSLAAQIYTDIINNDKSRFKQISKRPALFSLINQGYNEDLVIKRQEEIALEALKESTYNERDLHPLLVRFLSSSPYFKCLSKTIFHELSNKKQKNLDKWIHPDIIGVYFPYDNFEALTLNTLKVFNQQIFKVFSFELKKSINLSNIREYYFQAVSNSSWANEGYLVAPNICDDDELLNELSLLNNAFGIGIIRLNLDFIEQSEILFYSKQKENIDSNMLDRLILRNKNVKQLFTEIVESVKLGRTLNTTFDNILNDDDLIKFKKEKNIKSD